MEDIIRFLVIALAAVVVGSVLVVVKLHWRAWRKLGFREGILPLHVWLVAVGHVCYVVGTTLAAGESLADGTFTWRFYLYIIGSLFTLTSLIAVAVHIRAKR